MATKQKKELTPKQQTVKNVLNWIVNILCVILIIFALVVAIFTIIRSVNPDNITRVGDSCYFNVATDSMKPTFSADDVIIANYYDGVNSDGSDLKVGQVITFKANIRYDDGNLYESFNSHRIIHINKDDAGNVTSVRTRGDNQEGDWHNALEDSSSWDLPSVPIRDIVAVWGDVDESLNFTTGKMLKGVGGLANFMQHPVHGKTRFFCIVVLPLILLFVIYAFILVRTLIIAKLEKERKVAGETAISVDAMTEEEKQQLMLQLLAAQNAKSEGAEEKPAEQPSEDVAEENPVEESVSEESPADEPKEE